MFAKNCPRCAGTGLLRQERCEGCQGQGVAPRTEVVTVRVPAGRARDRRGNPMTFKLRGKVEPYYLTPAADDAPAA